MEYLDEDKVETLTNRVEREINEGLLPAAQIAIGFENKILFSKNFGDTKPDSLFCIFSATKAITSAASWLLMQKKVISENDLVTEYIPEFGENGKAKTTLSHLLTHTAGFTYDFMLGHPAIGLYKKNGLHDYKNIETQEEMNLEEFCNKLSTLPLLFEPGEKWHYSCSIDVLGRVIEVVSGMSLGDFFKDNIFKPLEMEDTGFYVENDKLERFSDCYQTMLGSKKKKMTLSHIAGKDEFSKNRNFLSGGGGLCSTISDYANFCQMLLDQGIFKGNRILSPTTVNFMTQNHLPNNNTLQDMGDSSFSETRFDGAGFGLGFSVIIDQVRSGIPASLGSFSWGGMASTFFWIDPKEELFSILLTQLIPSGRYPLRPQAQTLVYAAINSLNKKN